MPSREEKATRFLELHVPGDPLLMPNPWDAGSARLLASCGFGALATTSSGSAGALGRLDGGVTLTEALDHAALVVGAVDLPVSADFESGFADEPEGVADAVTRALGVGLAGCSVEDYTRDDAAPIYPVELATERIAAAAEAAHASGSFVLTARCENLIRGRDDLDDTIARLQRYREAGADVVFAPGLRDAADIARVVQSVDAPVNVLALPGVPSVPELAQLGVARVSVGGGFAMAAWAAVLAAADELTGRGTYGYFEPVATFGGRVRAAFATG